MINSSSMSNYWIDLGLLPAELIAVDGEDVAPIAGRRFPISVAQRLDLRIRVPQGPGAYPIFATLEGERSRTGIVLQAGGGQVTKLPDVADAATPALTLDLERRLRGVRRLTIRPADQVHVVNLTGSMAGYIWTLNGVPYGEDTPLPIHAGQRVEIVMVNTTPMPHPMHLHGHTFQVVKIDNQRFPGAMRDTVLVPPNTRVTIAFDADNPGRWAFHCHLLYHLDAGMMTTLVYV
jgi:FtsP/CotA-like multicopper oxidase with cupredoxin domain